MATSQAASAAAVTSAQADADQARLAAQQAQQNEHQADSEKAAMRAQLSEATEQDPRDTRQRARTDHQHVRRVVRYRAILVEARRAGEAAKVAGILIAYPSLNIAVGGYTDNVGGDDMNQKLSENRAGGVRDYLVNQGVAANSVSATGFGNSAPVASNDNASGRQENRRVELVVSGDAIGIPVNATTGSLN